MLDESQQTLFDVVVIGNVGIDTNVFFYNEGPNLDVESSFTKNLDCVGQAGGCSSKGFSRLGKRTAFIGYVGDDFGGRHIRQEFSEHNIDMSALFVDQAGTSRSINLMYRDGMRKNFYDGKSHMTLVPDLGRCVDVISGARIAHFHIPNWARHLLPYAKEAGACISCDLQDIVMISDEYRDDFIAFADVIFFSSINFPDPAPVIHALLEKRPQAVVVAGMGARGCALGTEREGIEYFDIVESDVPVVDTNGAGDALAVGFLSSLVLDGYDRRESIVRGEIAARHACTLKGTTTGLITREELDTRYRKLVQNRTSLG